METDNDFTVEVKEPKENTPLLPEYNQDKNKTWRPHIIGAVLAFISAATLTASLALVQVGCLIMPFTGCTRRDTFRMHTVIFLGYGDFF